MAGDTLFTRRARMGELIGIRRSQALDADLQTQMNGYVEDAIRKITRTHEWGFMQTEEKLEMEPIHIQGTIAVSAGGTAVTGTGTAFPTDWDREADAELRIGNQAYRVASITDATNLVLTDSALAEHTASAFQLYKPKYLLSTISGIKAIAPSGGAREPIKNVGIETLRAMKANEFSSRFPVFWATHSYVGDFPLIEVHPVPYDNEVMHVYGLKAPTIPSGDSDTDDIPAQWSKVVDLWATYFMFFAIEDPRTGTVKVEAEVELQRMMQEADANRDGLTWDLDPARYGNPKSTYTYGSRYE